MANMQPPLFEPASRVMMEHKCAPLYQTLSRRIALLFASPARDSKASLLAREIVICSHSFSCVSRPLQVLSWSFDWFTVLSKSFVIG